MTIPATMQAMFNPRYGSPASLQLTSISTPTATGKQVLVRVRAASLNPYDWHLLTGRPYMVRLSDGLRHPRRPVPGADLAGEVAAVGDAVNTVAVGDEVFGFGAGSCAQYCLAHEKFLVAKPAGVSFAQAAATPLAGFTAIQALRDKGQLQAGQTVLIVGATGGVGSVAIQIAKAWQAEVTAVCSGAGVSLARQLGADHVIDYQQEDFTRSRHHYDLVLDNVGNRPFTAIRSIIQPGGRYVAVGAPMSGDWIRPLLHLFKGILAFAGRSQTFNAFIAQQDRDDLLLLSELLNNGQLTPHISHEYSLANVAEGFARIAGGHTRGKLVVLPE